jgi:hypothetical protein
MKAVILAGGYGTRLSEETGVRPKPMVEIGGRPILWHIMKGYAHHGINNFVICLGYKGFLIKEFFANYFLRMADVTFDLRVNAMKVHTAAAEPWRVTLVDTGEGTMTGGRLRHVADGIQEIAGGDHRRSPRHDPGVRTLARTVGASGCRTVEHASRGGRRSVSQRLGRAGAGERRPSRSSSSR